MIPVPILLTCLRIGGEWFCWAARGRRNHGMFFCCGGFSNFVVFCSPFLFDEIKSVQVISRNHFNMFRLDLTLPFLERIAPSV